MYSLMTLRKFQEGGTQIWFGQGCAARASKPVSIFKGSFLAEKGTGSHC